MEDKNDIDRQIWNPTTNTDKFAPTKFDITKVMSDKDETKYTTIPDGLLRMTAIKPPKKPASPGEPHNNEYRRAFMIGYAMGLTEACLINSMNDVLIREHSWVDEDDRRKVAFYQGFEAACGRFIVARYHKKMKNNDTDYVDEDDEE